MLSEDDTTQTTGPLGQVPRTFDRRSTLSERRQSILQQKQSEKFTDALPRVSADTSDTPGAKVAWRQVVQLREENRRLRHNLEEMRSEMQRLISEYNIIQDEFEKEVTVIHSGQLQEVEHYQGHLQEVTNERNRLQESHFQLERRYQELYSNFQDAVEEEAQKVVSEAAQTLVLSPENAHGMFHDVKKTVELYARQVEDKQLVEVLYLKREVQRMNELLKQEHQQLEEERQKLLVMQNTAREQAELRHRTLQSRLRARWTAAFAFITTGVIALLIVLQCLFLFLLHVRFTPPLAFSIFAPILVCVIVAIVFSHPISMLRHVYTSAPHKKKVTKQL